MSYNDGIPTASDESNPWPLDGEQMPRLLALREARTLTIHGNGIGKTEVGSAQDMILLATYILDGYDGILAIQHAQQDLFPERTTGTDSRLSGPTSEMDVQVITGALEDMPQWIQDKVRKQGTDFATVLMQHEYLLAEPVRRLLAPLVGVQATPEQVREVESTWAATEPDTNDAVNT